MWKKYFGRVVMRGQKGIPILVGSDVNQRVSYIFDISQTTSMDRNINEVSLWQFDHENHNEALKEIIRDSSFEASDSINENIFSLSRIYGDEYINLALADLRIDIEDRLSFEKFMRDSISYAVANRFNTVYPMDLENLKNNFSRINTISLEQIGDNNTIGPFCCIDQNTILGDNNHLLNSVTIHAGARIGNGNEIFPGASIATKPQDLKYKGEETLCEIEELVRGDFYAGIERAGSTDFHESVCDSSRQVCGIFKEAVRYIFKAGGLSRYIYK